jgi:3D (Asp-Asp-Asp) domain-containing protein
MAGKSPLRPTRDGEPFPRWTDPAGPSPTRAMIISQTKLRCTAALAAAFALVAFSAGPAAATLTFPDSKPADKFVSAKASAYSSGSSDNGQWAGRTAIGTPLRSGAISSAAADWSKFPLGTKFRVAETGRVYRVDDYGSAMVGKVKVDLFTPSAQQMNHWGVRNVTLEILEWGNREKSLALLAGRTASRYAHIRKMVASLREQLNGSKPPNLTDDEAPLVATRTGPKHKARGEKPDA